MIMVILADRHRLSRRDDRRSQQLSVADGGEVQIQDDAVVHRQAHQDA